MWGITKSETLTSSASDLMYLKGHFVCPFSFQQVYLILVNESSEIQVNLEQSCGLANLKSVVLEREKNEREIVRRLDAGESQRGLAKEFKYSDRQVRNLAEKARHLH